MQGRWTTAAPGEPLDFYSRCEYVPYLLSFGSYTEVCTDRNYVSQLDYKAKHYTMLTHHSTQRDVFAYDNEEGLCAKLCKVKSKVPDVRFGIAVYDVDYDDFENECPLLNTFGSHSRLKALRKIVDFFKTLTSYEFDEASCTSVVPTMVQENDAP
ncbi:hypothetical protein V5799_015660 [Amblyomma americanum]|uniref:Uncharacterized protein n=1 Tax=Amblyomma americanum TaxID=6943 RepID=A0AAQ4F7D8_AMBAM